MPATDLKSKVFYIVLPVCLIAALCLCACSSETDKPPYIKAQVTDVYNNKTDIYNVHFMYWWQERGETVFLKTHTLTARELMTGEEPVSTSGQTDGDLMPVSIPLKDIRRIEWVVTETAKKMLVYTSDGRVVETQCTFPRQLRVDSASGLADYRLSITGCTDPAGSVFDFRKDIDLLKQIVVTGIDMVR